jgi:uncharacterized membrane protein YkoI
MRGKLIIPALILLMLLTSGMSHVIASPLIMPDKLTQLAARESVTLDEAVARVKKQTRGRILTAETTERKGKTVHRIKVLLPNGSVRVMYVDAE